MVKKVSFLTSFKLKYLKKVVHDLRHGSLDKKTTIAIVFLLLTGLFTITTFSIMRTQKETFESRASSNSPLCIYGSYMLKSSCETVCGDYGCRQCHIGTKDKWECRDQSSGTSGAGAPYNYPACKLRNFATKSNCKDDFEKCTKCTVGGKIIKWHEGISKAELRPTKINRRKNR